MPFQREDNYFNRFSRGKRFFELRNIAGEPPQAAEANEAQAVLRDLVQRAGDSVMQNGDIVGDGLYISPSRTGVDAHWGFPVQYFGADGGKVWIDGVPHEVDGDIIDLPVPSTGWGFVGVYLRKELVTSSDDATLRDPAVHDASGNPMGAPGANRLKITPIWVAGSLPVSTFDDKAIVGTGGRGLVGFQNSTQNPLLRPDITADTSTAAQITSASIYSAKVRFPGTTVNGVFTPTNLTDVSQIFVVTGPTSPPVNPVATMSVKAVVKLADTGANDVKVWLNFFKGNREALDVPTLAPGSIQTINPASGAVTLTLTLNDAMVAALSNFNQYQLGLVFETVSGNLDPATKLYIADLHVEMPTDLRRPPYKSFEMANGTKYSSFVVGPAAFIKHGKVDTVIVSNGQANSQPSSLDGLRVSDIPTLTTLANVDPIIRSSIVTSAVDAQFLVDHGVALEEALLRIYPIHITFDGHVISTLGNREFTRLTDDFLSPRLREVVPNSVVSGLVVNAKQTGTTGGGEPIYDPSKVTISAGQAFVNGRLFSIEHPPELNLPPAGTGTVTKNPPERQNYLSPTWVYTVLGGRFTDLIDVEIIALFKETVTHIQNPLIGEQAFDTRPLTAPPLSELDKLSVPAYSVLKVQNDSDGFIFKEGLDWGVVPRLDVNGNEVTVIGWHAYPETTVGGVTTRESKQPTGTFTVYYSAAIKLKVPALGSAAGAASTQVKYEAKSNYNVGFKVLSDPATIPGLNANVEKLKDWSHAALDSTLFGPYLVAGNLTLGTGSGADVAPTFQSLLEAFKYVTEAQGGYIVYFSGDVSKEGPDGAFGFELTSAIKGDGTRDLDQEKVAKATLLANNKLPLALVKVPIVYDALNPSIYPYDLRVITLSEQHDVNEAITDLTEVLPVLLSQMLVGGDFSSSEALTYEDSDADYAEARRLNRLTWSIDPGVFPKLAGYKVETVYRYYGDGDGDFHGLQDTQALKGLLWGFEAKIKDPANVVRKTVVVAFSYDQSSAPHYRITATNSMTV